MWVAYVFYQWFTCLENDIFLRTALYSYRIYRLDSAISDPNGESSHHRQTFYSDLLPSGVCVCVSSRGMAETLGLMMNGFSYLQFPGFPFTD